MPAPLHPVQTSPQQPDTPLLPLGLDGAIARLKVSASHAALTRTVNRALDGTGVVFRLAFTETQMYSYRSGRLVDADGKEVAPRARAWISDRIAAAGGDWRRVRDEIEAAGLRNTIQVNWPVYLVARVGQAAGDFIQGQVEVVREVLAPASRHDAYSADSLVDGPSYWANQQWPEFAPPRYQLMDIVDVRQHVERSALLHRQLFYARLATAADRTLIEHNLDTGAKRVMRVIDHPDYPKMPGGCRLHRLLEDWDASSAGAAARFEQHWVLRLEHYTWKGEETCDAIPRWTTRTRLPESRKARLRTASQLLAWLSRFDERAGHPFAWYFFAVHGNRVDTDIIRRVHELLLVSPSILPACDAAVVRNWVAQPYAF